MAISKKTPPKHEDPHPPRALERFIRIKEVFRPGDHYRAFQPEVIWVEGDKVIKRRLIDNPNIFDVAYGVAAECVDPRIKIDVE